MAATARAKKEARKLAESLGHHLSSFVPYEGQETAYCEVPACKARIVVQGARVEGHALIHVCPFLESDTRNGGS